MAQTAGETVSGNSGLAGRLLDLPPLRRLRSVIEVYTKAGDGLLAAGLAYSALFASLTGLLFFVGVLGYLVPSNADRQVIIDSFTGDLEPLAPFVNSGLSSAVAHAGAFSLIGLAGLAWGASQFYVALDEAMGRVFALAPARGMFDRILRGFVSILLLVGGLVSGLAFSAIQAVVTAHATQGPQGDAGLVVVDAFFVVATLAAIIAAVGVVYRVVPNTTVPWASLRVPAVVVGLLLTALTRLLVYIEPLLTGALSVFGSVAAGFAALAWLQLAFQVVLLGAAWTRVNVDHAAERESLPQP